MYHQKKGRFKMKVGLFTDTYYPQINGVATSVLMLKENLTAQGHQVYVFTTTDPDALQDEVNVYRLPSIPFASARRLGMFYHPSMAKTIKGLGLDLIHTHTEFSLGIFGRTMARELKIPTVHTMHTIYEDYTHYIVKFSALDGIAKSAARKLSSRFCNAADAVIVPTGKVRDLLQTYGVDRDISIIPTGIELDKFAKGNYDPAVTRKLRAGLGVDEKDKVLLYIGRMSEEKNIGEILTGLKGYLRDKHNVKLILIGDGPDKDNLEMMARELGIHKQTIFAGARPWDEIGLYYQLGDVFVSASQSETQGLTYIEALAAGLPVIAKADRCLDGVVQDGVNGYCFHGQTEFHQALDSILQDDLKKEKMSVAAARSTAEFSASHFADTVAVLYENVLKIGKAFPKAS